jgi:hypothetical protein
MKVKTSELQGAALDWAVAKAEMELSEDGGQVHLTERGVRRYEDTLNISYSPSTDWAQGGPIIEWESIFVLREQSGFKGRRLWAATSGANKAVGLNEDSIKLYRDAFYFGPTPLIAAMRCYVASNLGDEVEIPEELNQ